MAAGYRLPRKGILLAHRGARRNRNKGVSPDPLAQLIFSFLNQRGQVSWCDGYGPDIIMVPGKGYDTLFPSPFYREGEITASFPGPH